MKMSNCVCSHKDSEESLMKVQLEKPVRPERRWSELHFWPDLHVHCSIGKIFYLPAAGFATPFSVLLPFSGCTATSPHTVPTSPCSLLIAPSTHLLKLRQKDASLIYSLLKLLSHSCVKQFNPQFSFLPPFLPSTTPWSSLFLFSAIFHYLLHFSSAPYCSHTLCNLLDFNNFTSAEHQLNIAEGCGVRIQTNYKPISVLLTLSQQLFNHRVLPAPERHMQSHTRLLSM